MEQLEVTLDWQGPLRPGSFPSSPQSIEEMGLEQPGVYLCVQRYADLTALYVGKSGCLRKRIHEHLACTLGFQYWRRKDNPAPRSSFQSKLNAANRAETDSLYLKHEYAFIHPHMFGLGQFNDLEKNIAEAIREVERTEFYYCSTQRGISIDNESIPRPEIITTNTLITGLEALLIEYTYLFADQHAYIVCDNSRRETASGQIFLAPKSFPKWLAQRFAQGAPTL